MLMKFERVYFRDATSWLGVMEKVTSKLRLLLPHQAIIEFVAAVKRPMQEVGGDSLLSRHDALIEAESLMNQFDVIYPTDITLRTALRGMSVYRMSWFDAHLWAYAESSGIRELLSEDFKHGQVYGRVRIRNPFLEADRVMELPPLFAGIEG